MFGINLPTLVVGLIVLAVFVAIIVGEVKKRKRGGGCGCGCDGCAGCSSCHPKKN